MASSPLAGFLVSAALDIFQTLLAELDTEGRYLFLNAVANQLRYPNTHTHYFSFILLYLFAESNQVNFYILVLSFSCFSFHFVISRLEVLSPLWPILVHGGCKLLYLRLRIILWSWSLSITFLFPLLFPDLKTISFVVRYGGAGLSVWWVNNCLGEDNTKFLMIW